MTPVCLFFFPKILILILAATLIRKPVHLVLQNTVDQEPEFLFAFLVILAVSKGFCY